MSKSLIETITVYVRNVEEIFSQSVRDPWRDGPNVWLSGVEQVSQQVRQRPAHNARKLRIEVNQLQGDSKQRFDDVSAAWKNHCLYMSEAARIQSAELLQKARRMLLILLPWMLGALALSVFFDRVHPLPDFVNRLFSEGLVIIAWVMLWHPVELLIFDAGEPRIEARVFEKMAAMELEIVTADARKE